MDKYEPNNVCNVWFDYLLEYVNMQSMNMQNKDNHKLNSGTND